MQSEGVPAREQYEQEVMEFLAELIRFDTTNPPGNETAAAEFLRQKFEAEGIDAEVVESEPGRGSVIARLPGDGSRKSLLLLSHLDVVPVQEEPRWSVEPFAGVVQDGFVWGRGAVDCKSLAAMNAMVMLLLKRSGVRLGGDLLYAAVADEEMGGAHGAGFLARERPQAVRADYTINEGGGFFFSLGPGRKIFAIETGEKGILWLRLKFKGRPGHGSMPKAADNALVKLSDAVGKLSRHPTPKAVTPTVREFITGMLVAQWGTRGRTMARLLLDSPLSGVLLRRAMRDPERVGQVDAMLRMTISPNVAAAGGKTNIVPGSATLTCDCRLLPGQSKEAVYAELRRAGLNLADIEIEELESAEPSWSATDNEFYQTLEDVLEEVAPGVPVLPFLIPGTSDSRFVRGLGSIAYGFQPASPEEDGSDLARRVHGVDERIRVDSLSFGTDVILRVARRVVGASGA
ncbi:MAG: M20/M25/M40 family metallo-hydrolase [Chloroflexota bacterium]|nr:M20/M25/M40 family metallo-hydrolase [Chloroflexota bacterium]